MASKEIPSGNQVKQSMVQKNADDFLISRSDGHPVKGFRVGTVKDKNVRKELNQLRRLIEEARSLLEIR
jgi:hypothetical protein